jgi:hypothetical protein
MITAKERYEHARLINKIMKDSLEAMLFKAKREEAELLAIMQSECSHVNRVYEEMTDYPKREDWVYCHCKDCGKYLGRK